MSNVKKTKIPCTSATRKQSRKEGFIYIHRSYYTDNNKITSIQRLDSADVDGNFRDYNGIDSFEDEKDSNFYVKRFNKKFTVLECKTKELNFLKQEQAVIPFLESDSTESVNFFALQKIQKTLIIILAFEVEGLKKDLKILIEKIANPEIPNQIGGIANPNFLKSYVVEPPSSLKVIDRYSSHYIDGKVAAIKPKFVTVFDSSTNPNFEFENEEFNYSDLESNSIVKEGKTAKKMEDDPLLSSSVNTSSMELNKTNTNSDGVDFNVSNLASESVFNLSSNKLNNKNVNENSVNFNVSNLASELEEEEEEDTLSFNDREREADQVLKLYRLLRKFFLEEEK